eukprot:CAMPEP_0181225660 /NCGR_PEP_ID=MMETSP1096-20121128/31823_1 /TAXON_ID=156174 ORGANISM="Chrysochromulina ericina, Strain CCMP281" /NCGR_SAMPLE_ID=MMETSP1096 /ASSEMBLY_ACC=CAM_ASM_000453 /LENGTH=72 /DNA_ID=CAMNT_0023318913 /DNA_START=255 /DNA_END=473 /DNA_ORIENTATION=-
MTVLDSNLDLFGWHSNGQQVLSKLLTGGQGIATVACLFVPLEHGDHISHEIVTARVAARVSSCIPRAPPLRV